MEYYISIFVRSLAKEKFSSLVNTLEHFSAHIIQAEKDIMVLRCNDIHILACLLKMKEDLSEARFGFSQYMGLAKGLSKIAQFGEILISEEIEKQVIETYEITSLGMLSIEGMSSQILVCRIEKPLGELTYPESTRSENIIPRKQEIESLQNLLRVANSVLVIGPQGSGKTTFFDQLIDTWDDRFVYRTFCPAYSIRCTLKPITDIVMQVLGIHDELDISHRQQKIEARLKELDILDIGTSYLAILDFLELNEEESILEKLDIKTRVEILTDSVADVIKRISWTKPVVIIIEDAENMDDSSVTFMQRLMVKLVEEKVCILFSSSMSQININGLKEYELRNIDKKKFEDLIEKKIEEKITLPPTNALHVSQYFCLYEEEKKGYMYNQYAGETSLANFSLPFHDQHTIIKRRIDLLTDTKREFLYSLAVAGSEIYPDSLPIDQKNISMFDEMVNRQFLEKYHLGYKFPSPTLHNEIYTLVPDKKGRHERLADYYRRISGFEQEAAFHYLKSEEHKKAIQFLMKSGQLAVRKGGYESGIYYYNQALELCQRLKDSVDLEILIALNEGLADIYRSLGDEDRALKYYKVVLDSYKEILKE